MKKYNLITPEGTRDLLFEESLTLRNIENRLHTIFKSRGYSEVITPAIEFYDVFNSTVRYFSQESLYKLSDGKGRLIVMRPDSTMPIARLAATRLRCEKMPLKLFYNQNIFKVNPKNSGRDDEIAQSGIEIIGGDINRSDFEAVSIALEVLEELNTYQSTKSSYYRFEIGDCAFFKRLMSILSVFEINEDIAEEIRVLIETKNYPELNKKLDLIEQKCTHDDAKWVFDALRALPELFGGSEVFDKARMLFQDDEMLSVLDELKVLFNEIGRLGVSDKLFVDFGMVSKLNYYTGIIFKGYIEGTGKSILSGGRYDTLLSEFGTSQPAVGFAVNINASILQNSETKMKTPDVLVFIEEEAQASGIIHIRQLIKQGFTVSNALFSSFEEAVDYAETMGIKRIDIVKKSKIKTINLN